MPSPAVPETSPLTYMKRLEDVHVFGRKQIPSQSNYCEESPEMST